MAERRAAETDPAPDPAPDPAAKSAADHADEIAATADQLDRALGGPGLADDPSPAEEPAPEPVAEPLAELDLTPRTLSALAAADVTTIADLADHTAESLATIKGIGPKAVSEISDLLASTGRTLNESS